jgi:hypothetical protein
MHCQLALPTRSASGKFTSSKFKSEVHEWVLVYPTNNKLYSIIRIIVIG